VVVVVVVVAAATATTQTRQVPPKDGKYGKLKYEIDIECTKNF
jgi:hypothetical protein